MALPTAAEEDQTDTHLEEAAIVARRVDGHHLVVQIEVD
jgi:hypothetical protein